VVCGGTTQKQYVNEICFGADCWWLELFLSNRVLRTNAILQFCNFFPKNASARSPLVEQLRETVNHLVCEYVASWIVALSKCPSKRQGCIFSAPKNPFAERVGENWIRTRPSRAHTQITDGTRIS
jgi:hypothetical protein